MIQLRNVKRMKKIKQVLALAGVALLVGMYIVTLIMGITASPATQGMLMASLACTIIIPIILYAMMLVARVLENKEEKEEKTDNKH